MLPEILGKEAELPLDQLLQLTPSAFAADARAFLKLLDDVTLGQLFNEHEPPAPTQAEEHDCPLLATYHPSSGRFAV